MEMFNYVFDDSKSCISFSSNAIFEYSLAYEIFDYLVFY